MDPLTTIHSLYNMFGQDQTCNRQELINIHSDIHSRYMKSIQKQEIKNIIEENKKKELKKKKLLLTL